MKITPIETGFFKLDGGAMFGVVPKMIWQRSNPADENNLCTWAMRCLLLEYGNKRVLIDNGIGDKQDEKFFRHYYLHGQANLTDSLLKADCHPDEVTDMIHTHLHFDHCGGGVSKSSDGLRYETKFKNARYWVNEAQWNWATNPNPREKASFLTENIIPILESGQLMLIHETERWDDAIELVYVNGHTDGMTLPKFHHKGHNFLYMADLLPSVGHLPLAYVMGYDTRPLLTLEEKDRILRQAVEEEWILILEHDPVHEAITIHKNEKGQFAMKESLKLADF